MRSNIFAIAFIVVSLSVCNGVAAGATKLDANTEFGFHYLLAHQYIMHADFDLAELELEQALVRKPQSRKAHRDYMFTSLMHLNFPQALAEFMIVVGMGKAIPLTPEEIQQLDIDSAKLHYRKALKYGEHNRTDKEIYELRWASSYLPSNPTIMRSLAFALASSGEYDDAERLYKLSFDLVANPSTDEAYAHADYAYMISKRSRIPEAIGEIKKGIAIDPKSPALHADLAWFLSAKGDLAEAIQEIEKAIDLAPNYLVGTVDVPSGSKDSFGLPMLTHHKKLAIYSNAGLWAKLGTLLERQKKFPEAIKAYEKALQLDPQQDDIKASLSKLKK